MNIALFGKTLSSDRVPFFMKLIERLCDSNINILVYSPYYEKIAAFLSFPKSVKTFQTHEELTAQAQMIFSIGGDGTLLDIVPLVRDSGIPVLGINMGRLGFLSSISRTEIDWAIMQLVEKKYTLEKRTLLQLDEPKGLFGDINYALNDLSVLRKESSTLIVVETFVDNIFLNAYWADGLIIATPTGSTAYSLSAGGPIITPNSSNFVITPIAPHNLSVRPVVIPDDSVIRLRVVGRNSSYSIDMDSRIAFLDEPLDIIVRKADFCLNLVKMQGKDFFGTIREKMLWGLDTRN